MKLRLPRRKTLSESGNQVSAPLLSLRVFSFFRFESKEAKVLERALPQEVVQPPPQTLKQEIDDFVHKFAKNQPPEVVAALQESTRDLIDMGLAKTAIRKGDIMPKFSLPDIHGNVIHSTRDITSKGLTVLTFYRGSWCPICQMQLASYQKHLEDFQAQGVNLIAISPSQRDASKNMAETKSLSFTILNDVKNVVAKKFGLVFALDKKLRPLYRKWGFDIPKENGDFSYELPLAATYVIDDSGSVVYSHVEADYTKRPEVSDLLKVVSAIKGPGPSKAPTTLTQEIDGFVHMFVKNQPPEVLKAIQESTQDLIDMCIAEGAVRTGDFMPDFTLPDVHGELVHSTKDITSKGLSVLIFYRGNWSPFCQMQLAYYQKHLEDLRAHGVNLIAISPNQRHVAKEMAEKMSLEFTILNDVKNVVAKKFGLVYTLDETIKPIYRNLGFDITKENGDFSYEVPLAATYVIDGSGSVVYSHVEADYTKRPEPSDLLKELLAVSQKEPDNLSLQ